jgi:hypothetical protein
MANIPLGQQSNEAGIRISVMHIRPKQPSEFEHLEHPLYARCQPYRGTSKKHEPCRRSYNLVCLVEKIVEDSTPRAHSVLLTVSYNLGESLRHFAPLG